MVKEKTRKIIVLSLIIGGMMSVFILPYIIPWKFGYLLGLIPIAAGFMYGLATG